MSGPVSGGSAQDLITAARNNIRGTAGFMAQEAASAILGETLDALFFGPDEVSVALGALSAKLDDISATLDNLPQLIDTSLTKDHIKQSRITLQGNVANFNREKDDYETMLGTGPTGVTTVTNSIASNTIDLINLCTTTDKNLFTVANEVADYYATAVTSLSSAAALLYAISTEGEPPVPTDAETNTVNDHMTRLTTAYDQWWQGPGKSAKQLVDLFDDPNTSKSFKLCVPTWNPFPLGFNNPEGKRGLYLTLGRYPNFPTDWHWVFPYCALDTGRTDADHRPFRIEAYQDGDSSVFCGGWGSGPALRPCRVG